MENIIEKKFGRLTIFEIFSKNGRKYCKCKCECGNETIVRIDLLKSNHTRSCGCLQKEISSKVAKQNNKKDANIIEGKENYIIIKIESKGKIYDCLIDKEDYPKVKDYRWNLISNDYVESKTMGKNVLIHRLIMNCPKKLYVDHINHNTLDNRKINLRICTNSENNMNKFAKGINFRKDICKYRAYIAKNNKQISLGTFSTEEEAKEARKQAEIKYFGEFRYKN